MNDVVSDEIRLQYFEQGYIIIRGIIGASLIEDMREACADIVRRSIETGVPSLAWENREKAVPARIGHILREDRCCPAFVAQFEETPVVEIVEGLLQRPVRFALCGVLCGGGGHAYIQGWHRDTGEIRNEDDLQRDLEMMRKSVQMNAPLYPDRYLQVVPGSHRRFSTPEEKQVFESDPTGDMPGALTVEMEPGDAVFYYPQLIHRGYNPEGHRRFSMHHCFWDADEPVHRHELESVVRLLDGYGPKTRLLAERYLKAMSDSPPNILRS